MDERNFRCIRLTTEHRFAEEYSSQRYAVESTDQCAVEPRFNGMRIALFMQMEVGLDHLRCDPRSVLKVLCSRLGADMHNGQELRIQRHNVFASAQYLSQAS